WGWTDRSCRRVRRTWAGPTHVGMDRDRVGRPCARPGRPHARGDGPLLKTPGLLVDTQAPRTWGWTVQINALQVGFPAGPTHVGMGQRCFVPGLMEALKPGNGTRHGSTEEVPR